MKPINFSTPVPPEEQKEIRRWFIRSVILVLFVFVGMGTFLSSELIELFSLQNANKLLNQQLNPQIYTQKEALKKEKELLAKRLSKINQSINQPKNPHEQLIALGKLNSNDLQIKNVDINKKNIELTMHTRDTNQALQSIKTLHKTNKFKNLELVSFQPGSSDMIMVKIKGEVA